MYSIKRLPFRWDFPFNWQKAPEERFPTWRKGKENKEKRKLEKGKSIVDQQFEITCIVHPMSYETKIWTMI
jgi:hypothetical protein